MSLTKSGRALIKELESFAQRDVDRRFSNMLRKLNRLIKQLKNEPLEAAVATIQGIIKKLTQMLNRRLEEHGGNDSVVVELRRVISDLKEIIADLQRVDVQLDTSKAIVLAARVRQARLAQHATRHNLLAVANQLFLLTKADGPFDSVYGDLADVGTAIRTFADGLKPQNGRQLLLSIANQLSALATELQKLEASLEEDEEESASQAAAKE